MFNKVESKNYGKRSPNLPKFPAANVFCYMVVDSASIVLLESNDQVYMHKINVSPTFLS